MSIANRIHEWQEDMKTRIQRVGILAETFDDIGTLLRDHDGGLGDDIEDKQREKEDD